MNDNLFTRTLLNGVVHQLSYIEDTKNPDKMAQFKTAFARITEKYHKLTCEVNDLSVLFHCIHEIITTSNCSYPESDRNEENWPCKFIYEGEVHVYQYRKRSIEVSILNEEATGSDIQFCYTVFNFPNETETPLYYVHRFNKKDIPTLALLNETADSQRYRNIYFAIENIWITFCSKVVSKKIEKTVEYCMYAIQPILSMEEEEEPAKKSKKKDESSSKVGTAAKQFVSPLPTGYERLIALYKSVTNKITEAGRLMALVHEILRVEMGCTSSIDAETWPGGVDYKGNTIEVWLSYNSSVEGQGGKVELRYFYLSILENDKEFYLSLRSYDDDTYWIVKKIVRQLVPSFDGTELELEREKVDNISMWLASIWKNFVEPTLAGTYRPPSLSILSTSLSSVEDTSGGSDDLSGASTPS